MEREAVCVVAGDLECVRGGGDGRLSGFMTFGVLVLAQDLSVLV